MDASIKQLLIYFACFHLIFGENLIQDTSDGTNDTSVESNIKSSVINIENESILTNPEPDSSPGAMAGNELRADENQPNPESPVNKRSHWTAAYADNNNYGTCPALSFLEAIGAEGLVPCCSSDLLSEIPSLLDPSNQSINTTAERVVKKINCIPRNQTDNETSNLLVVEIVNSTGLLHKLSHKNDSLPGNCAVVLFYAPWCMFCAKTAPNFNALPRAFPQLHVLAIDAVHFSSLNSRFGTIAVPNILVFHNSKAVARFNNSARNLDTMVDFIANVTGLSPNRSVTITSEDYIGPLPSEPTQKADYLLWLSWVVVIVFCGTMVTRSSVGQKVLNALSALGHEEHQHVQ